MALFPCPECKKNVSTAAFTCPHCGAGWAVHDRKWIQTDPSDLDELAYWADVLVERLYAARELHVEVRMREGDIVRSRCGECSPRNAHGFFPIATAVDWPCPTIRALGGPDE